MGALETVAVSFSVLVPECQAENGMATLLDNIEIDETRQTVQPSAIGYFLSCPFLMFSTIVTSFGGILFGFDTAALNGILIMPPFVSAMGGDNMTATEWADLSSWITSSLLLGASFASLFAALVADTLGRKVCINLSSLIILIGASVQAAAQGWQIMIIGRVIVGFGIGCLSATVPIYLAEISPKSVRGAVGSLFEVTVAFGILLAFAVTWCFNSTSSFPEQLSAWRCILGIQAGLAICLTLLMIPLPESPRWLVTVGRQAEARQQLRTIRWSEVVGKRRVSFDEWLDVTNVDLEYAEMLADSEVQSNKGTVWYDYSALLRPDMLLRTCIAINIKIFQQLTGINSIMYYSSIIFEDIGIKPDTTTAITGLVNVIATLISVILIDHWGRRPLLIWGSVGMCVSLVILGGIVLGTNPSEPASAMTIAAFICFFIVNFAYSYGPIAWLYPAEIFPMSLRAKGSFPRSILLASDTPLSFI